MSEDRSWGADTVAFGRASRESSCPVAPRARSARPKLPTIALRPLALVTVAIVAVVALLVAVGGGSDSKKAPIREVADPAPRVVVKQARRVRRREPRGAVKPPAGRVEAEKREPKASPATQAQTAPEPPAEPAPQYVPPPSPEPTPPAAEFGL